MRTLVLLGLAGAFVLACATAPRSPTKLWSEQEKQAEYDRQRAAAEGGAVDMQPPPGPDPEKRRDDAILLETLIGAPSRVSFSAGAVGGGLAYLATGVTYVGGAAVYLARGGSVVPTIVPGVFGAGSLGLGSYYLLAGGDLLTTQLDLARELQANTPHEAILATFEPRVERLAARARSRRMGLAYGLFGLSILTTAAAVWTTTRPISRLEGGALPTVLYGTAVIDVLGGISYLTYESPAEIAWKAYVQGSTPK
jgi:hypothetical protein